MELQAPTTTQNFSIPEFNEFMSTPLSHTSGTISGWHIFSGAPQNSNSIAKRKIKGALELFDFIHFPSLVQFWSPSTCHQFLHSSDLPFALNGLRKGICSFRKHCSSYRYRVHGDYCGPPARVFRQRYPEFCPDVRWYFEEEYELKRLAMAAGIRGYLCLPVFEPDWNFCIGVLEFLTIMDGSFCFRDVIGKVSASLKEVGFRCSDVFWQFDPEHMIYNQLENASPQYELAVRELQNAMDVLCRKHKLPFAQTWLAISGGSSKESAILTVKGGSYITISTVSSFQRDCSWFHLGKRQGIVWEAFVSGCCFCRDITRLGIVDYALVLGARKVELKGGFAICLQSSCAKNLVYILELFLPQSCSIDRQPWIFLTLLLDTMKQLFKNFKLWSGEEIGSELRVAVLQTSQDDPLHPFMICKTMHAGEGLRNRADDAQLIAAEANISGPFVVTKEKSASSSYFSKCVFNGKMVFSHNTTTTNRRSELNPEKIMLATNGAMGRAFSFGEAVIPDVKRNMPNSMNPVSDTNEGSSRKRNEVDCVSPSDERNICLPSVSSAVTPMKNNETILTVKADFEGDVVKFKVPAVCGLMKLKDEIMKRLKLNTDTFEIHHCENNIWVLLDTDAKLCEYAKVVRSSGRSTIKLSIVSVVQQTEEVVHATKMTVKASYKGDLIKFESSLSAGMSELKNEITKRLKLVDGSFEIKVSDENGCLILLDGDAALQDYINRVMQLQKSTVRLFVQPITMIVKASYRDDIIKFNLCLSSAMMNLKNEVRKRLKLEDGSFVVKYVDDDRNEVLVEGDAALTKYMNTMASLGMHTIKISLQSVGQTS